MSDKGKKAYENVVYDLFLWVFTIVVDLFFREIHHVQHGESQRQARFCSSRRRTPINSWTR
jgi:hypothetical protein